LKQAQATNNSRIQQLERDIQRGKQELDQTNEENERLTLALESGSGLPNDVKSRSATSYLYDDEPKQTREERKAEFAELSASKPEIEPEPTEQDTKDNTTQSDITVTEQDNTATQVADGIEQVAETVQETTQDTEQSF